MTTTFNAHVDSAVADIRKWQGGEINWRECLRRVDVTAAGEKHLEAITRTTPQTELRRLATLAVAARTM